MVMLVARDIIDTRILELFTEKSDITEAEIASRLGLDADEVRDEIKRLSDTRVKVLIVDDEKDTIIPLRIFLESNNYSVIEAYAGHEAIRKALAEVPDIILLDLMLPDMDGYEVCNSLKEEQATRLIPIIMVTGKGAISSKIEGLERGADDYITKPFNLNELEARIRTVLRRSMT